MAGFGALAQLDLDHPHLVDLRRVAEAFGVEATGAVARAEIAAAEFPHDVAAMRAVIGADAALAGVVLEAAGIRPQIERLDSACAELSETHRRNVHQRDVLGSLALRVAAPPASRPVFLPPGGAALA